jgi:hypothetical protein
MVDVRPFSVLPDTGDSELLRIHQRSSERVIRAERSQPQAVGLPCASGFYLPETTDQACGTVVLRTHSHRAAHHDSSTGAAQMLVIVLFAIGLLAALASRFESF